VFAERIHCPLDEIQAFAEHIHCPPGEIHVFAVRVSVFAEHVNVFREFREHMNAIEGRARRASTLSYAPEGRQLLRGRWRG
jgi:hypothetical protein